MCNQNFGKHFYPQSQSGESMLGSATYKSLATGRYVVVLFFFCYTYLKCVLFAFEFHAVASNTSYVNVAGH